MQNKKPESGESEKNRYFGLGECKVTQFSDGGEAAPEYISTAGLAAPDKLPPKAAKNFRPWKVKIRKIVAAVGGPRPAAGAKFLGEGGILG